MRVELDDGRTSTRTRSSSRSGGAAHDRRRARHGRARAGEARAGRRVAPRSRARLALRRRRRQRPGPADAHGEVPGAARADAILGKRVRLRSDGGASPRVIFTDPQVGAVGLTLAAAAEAGLQVRAVDVETSGNAGGSFVGAARRDVPARRRRGAARRRRRDDHRRRGRRVAARGDDRGRRRGAARGPVARGAVVPDPFGALAAAARGLRALTVRLAPCGGSRRRATSRPCGRAGRCPPSSRRTTTACTCSSSAAPGRGRRRSSPRSSSASSREGWASRPELVLVELRRDDRPGGAGRRSRTFSSPATVLNLGVDFLRAAALHPPAGPAPDPDFAADVVWLDALATNVDRTAQNPNLLWWHERLWLIDHGAALYFHHRRGPADHARMAASRPCATTCCCRMRRRGGRERPACPDA